MSFRNLRQLSLLSALACATGSATAGVELRVESMPIVQPIDAYILVTDGESPVAGLTTEDFSITLDGAALEEFEFSLPPRQDPRKMSSSSWRQRAHPARRSITGSHRRTDVGDHVSIVNTYPEADFDGKFAILPFTRIDGGMDQMRFLSSWAPDGRPSSR
jgi:hypothetical protein